MRRYRLHDLLRAAAVTWLAACSSGPSAPATTADAVGDTALDASGGDAVSDALEGTDAAGATDAMALTDAAAGTDATAVTDAAAGTDAGSDTVAATDASAGTDVATGTDASSGSDAAASDVIKDTTIGPKLPFPCLDPQPVVVQGQDTGVDVCANGMIRRREAKACPAYQPNPAFTCGDSGWEGGCKTDADCPTGPCQAGGFIPGCACVAGCQTDADCGQGNVCLCGPQVGTCVPSACTSDADCGAGSCGTYDSQPGCQIIAMACQTEGDECAVDADCSTNGGVCTWDSDKGRRYCAPFSCAIGRPFAVDGSWRTAGLADRTDWREPDVKAGVVDLTGLSSDARAALGGWWQEAGAMEHASVASFARLTLELMAVGAPPDLLARSQQAGLDEVRHAERCFALASQYLGRNVGPGRLAIGGSLRQPVLAEIAAAAAAEGCVWETCAALEARVAANTARDPALAHLLGQIADDEANHAELAWDLVRWALQAGRDKAERSAVRAAVAAALDAASAALQNAGAGTDALSAGDAAARDAGQDRVPAGYGVLGAAEQRRLRAHALAQVIAPARARLGL